MNAWEEKFKKKKKSAKYLTLHYFNLCFQFIFLTLKLVTIVTHYRIMGLLQNTKAKATWRNSYSVFKWWKRLCLILRFITCSGLLDGSTKYRSYIAYEVLFLCTISTEQHHLCQSHEKVFGKHCVSPKMTLWFFCWNSVF